MSDIGIWARAFISAIDVSALGVSQLNTAYVLENWACYYHTQMDVSEGITDHNGSWVNVDKNSMYKLGCAESGSNAKTDCIRES
jgi:hypothetical protein